MFELTCLRSTVCLFAALLFINEVSLLNFIFNSPTIYFSFTVSKTQSSFFDRALKEFHSFFHCSVFSFT
jgi:hypothetical protein